MKDYTRRFTGRASLYSIARPGYPHRVLEILESELDLTPTWTIADIGSGTGLLSQLFVENGNRVFGVEPNDEMRRYAELAFRDKSNFVSVNGTAEATGIEGSSVDLVAAGQAFHWFNPEMAAREFLRILKGDSRNVCIVYNNRAKDDRFMDEYERIIRKYARDRATVPDITDAYLSVWFQPGSFKRFVVQNEQFLDRDLLLGRMLSASYMPSESEVESVLSLEADVTHLFTQYENHGKVRMLYETEVSMGQL